MTPDAVTHARRARLEGILDQLLRILDRESGGWGNVGLDHVVFSDREDAGALEIEMRQVAGDVQTLHITHHDIPLTIQIRTLARRPLL